MAERNIPNSRTLAGRHNVRRIILIGKTGNGKSSTGNSILGLPEFNFEKSPSAITQNCEVRTSIDRKDWPLYKVCDTPGLLDTEVKLVDRVLEIQRSVKVCPNPHAFLLVFSSASRMTEDERFTVDLLRIMFGEDVFKHCIVVFTRGDEFKQEDDFIKFMEKSPKILVTLLEECDNRVARIENKISTDNANIGKDISRLLALVEQVSLHGERVYKYSEMGTHTKVLNKLRPSYKEMDRGLESMLQEISGNIGRELKHNRWKVALVGATAICGVGFAGYGAYVAGHAAINAAPAIACAVGKLSGSAIGGYVGGFAKMAAVGFANSIKFWK